MVLHESQKYGMHAHGTNAKHNKIAATCVLNDISVLVVVVLFFTPQNGHIWYNWGFDCQQRISVCDDMLFTTKDEEINVGSFN